MPHSDLSSVIDDELVVLKIGRPVRVVSILGGGVTISVFSHTACWDLDSVWESQGVAIVGAHSANAVDAVVGRGKLVDILAAGVPELLLVAQSHFTEQQQ